MNIIEGIVVIVAILCITLTIMCYMLRDKLKGDDK